MAKVPGTFKNKPPAPQRGLDPLSQRVVQMLLAGGCLVAEVWYIGECKVIAAREPLERGGYAWHVSISHDTRYPSWDEMKSVLYWPGMVWAPQPGKVYAQLLGPVAEGEWVDVHENCFHLYEIEDPR